MSPGKVFAAGSRGVARFFHPPYCWPVTYHYLVRSPRHLVQYLAGNLLPKGYHFHVAMWLPEDADPVLVDAKLTLLYECHLPKERQYRRRKAGLATVKYVRCGRLAMLLATRGRSPFFAREPFRDAREAAVHVAGYALSVVKVTGKVSVRVHREAQRRVRRQFTEQASRSLDWWERTIRDFPFAAYAGVRDQLFAELRHLNACRRSLRLPPVDWRNCVRKKFKVEPVFLDTPPELLDLLRHQGWTG